MCEQRGFVPGQRIYVHPKGQSTAQAKMAKPVRGRPRKGTDPSAKAAEEVSEEEGEWSIWEVDGEKDVVSLSPDQYSRR
jgi:hypothetical protein